MDKRTVLAVVRGLKEQVLNLEKLVLMMPENGGGPIPVYPTQPTAPSHFQGVNYKQPVQPDPRFMTEQDEDRVEKLIEMKRQEAQAISEEAMPTFQQMQAEAMAQAENMNIGLQSGSGLADSIHQLKNQ